MYSNKYSTGTRLCENRREKVWVHVCVCVYALYVLYVCGERLYKGRRRTNSWGRKEQVVD